MVRTLFEPVWGGILVCGSRIENIAVGPLPGRSSSGSASSKAAVAGQRAQCAACLVPSSHRNQALQRGDVGLARRPALQRRRPEEAAPGLLQESAALLPGQRQAAIGQRPARRAQAPRDGALAQLRGQALHGVAVVGGAQVLAQGSDEAAADALHEEAHAMCYIAQSVNFPITVEAQYLVG